MISDAVQPYYKTVACSEILGRVAQASRRSFPSLTANFLLNYKLMRKPFEVAFKTHDFKHAPMAISPDEGEFLYQITRAKKASLVVEFGTSFGVSAIYLASALRDQGSGRFIGAVMVRERAFCKGTMVTRASQHPRYISTNNALANTQNDSAQETE